MKTPPSQGKNAQKEAQILKRQLQGVSKRRHAKQREGREAPGLLLLSAQRPEEAVSQRLRFVAQPFLPRGRRCLPGPSSVLELPPGPGPSLALMPGLVAGWFGQRPGKS